MNLPSGTKEDPPGCTAETLRQENCSTSGQMITTLWPDVTRDQWQDWKWQMSHRVKTLEPLARILNLKPHQVARYKRLIDIYHYSITPYYLSLVSLDDLHDPIAKQCLPDPRELELQIVGDNDPLNEEKDMPVPGLVHRYPDRVLAVITDMCAMYCRHCTRKRMWCEGEKGAVTLNDLARMVHYVRTTPEVREVIISGGDPLTVNMDQLDWFLGELGMISHLEVIRIGTRVPVVLPMKITSDLTDMLSSHRPLWINIQVNHPREITEDMRNACDRILRAGIPLSNQSVLLRGINDSAETMSKLSHALQRIMVRPYYLFQCDPVRGVEHFRTSIWKGIEIIEKMRGFTGGLCVPTFVVDAPGGGGKIPLQPFYLLSASDRDVLLRNYEGRIIQYYNPGENDSSSGGGSGRNTAEEVVNGLSRTHDTTKMQRRISKYKSRMEPVFAPACKPR